MHTGMIDDSFLWHGGLCHRLYRGLFSRRNSNNFTRNNVKVKLPTSIHPAINEKEEKVRCRAKERRLLANCSPYLRKLPIINSILEKEESRAQSAKVPGSWLVQAYSETSDRISNQDDRFVYRSLSCNDLRCRCFRRVHHLSHPLDPWSQEVRTSS